MDYKLTIFGANMHKEVQVTDKLKCLSIGTDKECHIRFSSNQFGIQFRMDIEHREDKYILFCDSDIYFRTDEYIGEKTHFLEPGDQIAVCYSKTNVTLFYLDFSIDYGNANENYNYRIGLPTGSQFSIGTSPSSSIRVYSEQMGDNYVTAYLDEKGLFLDISNAGYGVSVNGILIRNSQIILKNHQFISIYGHMFYFEQGFLYTCDDGTVTTCFPGDYIFKRHNSFKYPRFVRNPRKQFVMPSEKIEVLAPKAAPQEEKNDLLVTILPMIVSMTVMLAVRSMMSSNGMYMIYFGVSMGMSVVMSIVNYYRGKKERKKQARLRIINYDKYLDIKEKEVQELREVERLVAGKMNASVIETIGMIDNFDARLFEKEKVHKDFLDVWVGTGTIESVCQIEYKKQEYIETEDPLMNYPEQMHDKYRYLDNMPIVLHLSKVNAIGVIGNRSKLYQFAKNMLVTIAGQHFYQDVKLFVMMNEDDVPLFEWSRWLQNTADNDNKYRYFIYDDESRKRGLQFLYSELSNRMQNGKRPDDSYFVVFVYRTDELGGHPVTNFVENANSLGFTFIFFDEHEEQIHHAAQEMIYLEQDEYRGSIRENANGEKVQYFVYPHVSRDDVLKSALRLAPIYIDEISLESTLTKNISLYELLGIMSAYDLDLRSRWSESEVWKSMAAPIGVVGSGEVLSLDIHETGHGPHGLVAGTTGSGKSELLQTFILSLATRFNPHEVAFVIIDFKGGGMANQFKKLPHLCGAITNIDGKQIDRSLMSIRAELLKRQELFAEFGVNRIDDYIKLQREGKAKVYLPHLILIVDEFAELKSDQPEFMKELISTARIGRSLGVHLILATQKPSGVVNDQIWSNSRFKLCLKVQDKSDSNEVIKSPLAAEIKEPGRAYLQVGNNEIFELFQSAYSGAPALVAGVDEGKEFTISKVKLSGEREVIYEQKKNEQTENESQMTALVNYIYEYCEKNDISKLPDICLPPLKQVIPFTLDGFDYKGTDIVIPIGIYDNPHRQEQKVLTMDITAGNTIIVGASQTGKTGFIQEIIRSACEIYSPDEVEFIIMDFASNILKIYEQLIHVSGVATAEEDEKVNNIIKILKKELDERKSKISGVGLSSFSAYRQAGYSDLKQIILMIDNYAAFKELYPGCVDDIQSLARDSVSMGIVIILSSPLTSVFGMRLLTYFNNRYAFTCNDKNEYSFILDRCKILPDNIPGRCVYKNNGEYFEAQLYQTFDAESEIELVSKSRDFIKEMNSKYSSFKKKGIPVVPSVVSWNDLIDCGGEDAPYVVPIGISYSSVNTISINFSEQIAVLVSGDAETSKLKFIKYLITRALQVDEAYPIDVHIFDDEVRSLSEYSNNKFISSYSNQLEDMNNRWNGIYAQLVRRYEIVADKGIEALDSEAYIVLFINNKDYYTYVSSDRDTLSQYKDVFNKLRNMKILIWITNVEVAYNAIGIPEFIKIAREEKCAMTFKNLKDQNVMELPAAVIRQFKKPLKENEAFILKKGSFSKINTTNIDICNFDK